MTIGTDGKIILTPAELASLSPSDFAAIGQGDAVPAGATFTPLTQQELDAAVHTGPSPVTAFAVALALFFLLETRK
jgi:hypothetical protein